MNKRVQEMHEHIILMLIAFDLVRSEPDILKHILIITYFTLRGKVKLILILNRAVQKYETLKCMMGVSMYHVFQHVITRYHMNLKDRGKLPMPELIFSSIN